MLEVLLALLLTVVLVVPIGRLLGSILRSNPLHVMCWVMALCAAAAIYRFAP